MIKPTVTKGAVSFGPFGLLASERLLAKEGVRVERAASIILLRSCRVPTRSFSEVHRTWNRPEALEIAKLYDLVSPNYAAVTESYKKAQEVARAAASR